MIPASPALREGVTRLLVQEAGKSRSSEELGVAIGRVYEQLSRQLTPLIGENGVHAIFTRCVNLTKSDFSFLDTGPAAGPAESLSRLQASLREQEPADIREMATVLFTTFAGLLATFVGEHLVWQLFSTIWADAFPPPGGPGRRPDHRRGINGRK